MITDYRCIEHADFPQKRNIKEKAFQRSAQPENSDRLSLLVDEQNGLFTKGIEFQKKQKSTLWLKDHVSERAKIADILQIHDYNYIQTVIEDIVKAQETGNKVIGNFDN